MSTYPKFLTKFSPRAKPSVFLGYPTGYKGYKVLDLETIVISVTRNLVFHETVFPFKNPSMFPASSDDLFPNTILPLPISELFVDVDSSLHSSSSLPSSTSTIPTSSSSLPHTTVNVSTGLDLVNLDRLRRQTKVPSYLSWYHCSFIHQIPQPLRSSFFKYLSSFFCSFLHKFQCFLSKIHYIHYH